MTTEELFAHREDIISRREAISATLDEANNGRRQRELDALYLFENVEDYHSGELTAVENSEVTSIAEEQGIDLAALR